MCLRRYLPVNQKAIKILEGKFISKLCQMSVRSNNLVVNQGMTINSQGEQVQRAWSSVKELHERVEQELGALEMSIRIDPNQLVER